MKRVLFIVVAASVFWLVAVYRNQYDIQIRTPAFSPDATRLIFSVEQGNGIWIYSAPAVGGDAEPIGPKTTEGFGATFSPTGAAIAYAALADDTRPIVVLMDAHSGVSQKFMASSLSDYAPQFSPDGSRLYFVRSKRFGKYVGFWLDSEIHSARLDGTDIMQVGSRTCSTIGSFSVSPRGNELVADMSCGERAKLWRILLNQPGEWQPLRPRFGNVPDPCQECSYPRYLSDGKAIAFIRPRRGQGPYIGDDVFVMDLANERAKLALSHDAYIMEPSISHKGDLLVFVSARGADRGDRECELRVADLNTRTSRRIEVTLPMGFFGHRKITHFRC